MSSPQIKQIEQKLRKLELLVNNNGSGLGELRQTIRRVDTAVNILQNATVQTPTAPVGNLLWNGELGHSVNSWRDTAYVTTDKARECAWFFSHETPFTPKTFSTITTNNEIPVTSTGIENGTPVMLTTTGTLPSGGASPPALIATYFTYSPSASVIKLATTRVLALAGTPDVTFNAGTGSGTHRLEMFLSETDTHTSPGAANQTLKAPQHFVYNNKYSDWDSTTGQGRITGKRSIDTPLPSNMVDATLGNFYVSFVCAKRKSFIEIPSTARIGVGIADNTSGQRDWLKGDIGFTGSSSGTGATTRRYRMYVVTNRGYSILSPEVEITTAPADGTYNPNNFITLSWRAVPGYLFIQLIQYTPGTGVYRLMEELSSGASNYVDNGSFLRTLTGYPSATGTERKAVFYSTDGELDTLATDGTPWDTFFAPIGIPDNYNKGLTSNRQWLRIWMTEACNVFVAGCTTDGSTTITAPSAVFEATSTVLAGLLGQYFSETTWTAKEGERVDSNVDFPASENSPGFGLYGRGPFSIRWTGFVKPRYTGSYTFTVSHDNGAKLIVNGVTLFTSTSNPGTSSGTISLNADTFYSIQLDMFQLELDLPGNQWRCILSWSSTGAGTQQSFEVIPNSQLFLNIPSGNLPGLTALVYDSNDTLLTTTTIVSRTDDTHAVLGTTTAAGTGRKLRIVGGGFHGLLVDKIHGGYQRNVSFAPNALDTRALQPLAAPNGSSQGGPGAGGEVGGGGGIRCVTLDTPVWFASGECDHEAEPAEKLTIGRYVKGENSRPNMVWRIERGLSRTRLVACQNGAYKNCTDHHRFRKSRWDAIGISLRNLRVGDYVMTSIDGRDEMSPIKFIGELSEEPQAVIHPRLEGGGHYYLAGSWKAPSWRQKLLILLRLMKPKKAAIYEIGRAHV